MGKPIEFAGVNRVYGPPKGREEQVGNLPVFMNGTCIVSAWKLTPAELEEVIRTGTVFLSSMSGEVLFPMFVGSESVVRSVVVDHGAIWPREENNDA